ncbi:hypothetical protein [Promicromonospora iranensis]|uniref:DUF2975 family protein n=1 Tax=Promicromonospora iranensis TaxID=1105144 RepID=A0ABU2CHT2_9MICO|nr:hypothetical protein [Promicromonospora iranensis]MDR7380884.1 hypothetical protein [Promicromonospora iranensis]
MAKWLGDPRGNFEVMMLAGGLAVLAGLGFIIRDLVRILPNRDVPVPVDLTDVPHDLLLDGTASAEVTEAVIQVSGLGPFPHAIVLAAALMPTLTLMVVAVCFAQLGRSFLKGDFFTAGCLVAITTAAFTLMLGASVIPLLEVMAANSALATVDISFGQPISVDVVMFVAGFALGVVGYAFQRGARLQRDTEGLV